MGDVAQQLALAADQALQACAHAVEVVGQYAELVAAGGQLGQAGLLVRCLAEVVYGAAQALQRAGERQGQEQAEQADHQQADGQGAEGPEPAVAMPGGKFRVGQAVNQQVAGAALGAGVFAG